MEIEQISIFWQTLYGGDRIMKGFLKLLNLLFLLFIILFAIVAAFSGIDLYLLLSGQVQPGDTMYVSEKAPDLDEALGPFVVSLVAMAVFILARMYIRKN